MNILFIDDTAQLGDRYVGIGGVIFHDDVIGDLCEVFAHTKESHDIPPTEEIKWSPKRSSWIYHNLTDDKRISAYSDILDLVRLFKGTAIVAVMRRDKTSFDLVEAKWKCIELMTERFQFFLRAQEDKNGIIIADVPGSDTDDKKLLNSYYEFLGKGTDYVTPLNVVMNLLTTPSHLNPGLQLADLVVGVTTAMCTNKRDYASDFWPLIKRNMHRNIKGIVMGCGLKVFPKEFADSTYERLFPEYFEAEEYEHYESYESYIEEMRYSYSVLMTEAELDMHFPRR